MDNVNGSEPARTQERRAPRQRAFLRAKLSYLDGAISIDCIVTQISATGAKIDIGETVSLPERFRIAIPQRQIDRVARLVRRGKDGVALAFCDDAESAEPDVHALRERLRTLEAENKMLRASVEALSAQLERMGAAY